MTYVFTFDASACTGCKACQIACKDKNNLPMGVLWRRVYEISGGTWINVGVRSSCPDMIPNTRTGELRPYDVWETDVFAYNLSMACNHCVHPKCAGVCPVDAYVVRDDGIVYIDESKCMGCGYCSWACPYAAPRYSHELHHMTKCNLCFDNLDAGLPPACVAACPMRVLELVDIREQREESRGVALWQLPGTEHPFPLPKRSRTEPHLTVNPHVGMTNGLAKTISNQEEIKTWKGKSELPLVFFTLLGQMAAGIAMWSLYSGSLTAPLLVALGGLIGASGLISIFHLGTPLNAWRALLHLKKSWLSREILFFGFFGGSWLLSLFVPGMGKLLLALTGIGFIYSMSQVYRLRSVPAWDSWHTNVGFFVTALLLGCLAILSILGEVLVSVIGWSLPLLFSASLALQLFSTDNINKTASRLRLGLTAGGIFVSLGLLFNSGLFGAWIAIILFVLALVEETIGRWLFYEHLHCLPL